MNQNISDKTQFCVIYSYLQSQHRLCHTIHTVFLEVWKPQLWLLWISRLHKHNPWVVILSNVLYLSFSQHR